MHMPFSWSTTHRPIVALAPMAGVTDASYRQLIKRIAPEVVVYTEFLSTDAIHFGAKKTLEMLNFDPAIERPFIVQVFGHDPEHFLSAAKVIEALGADGIDINMGCPAARVVSSCHGSALIREPDLAARLVEATVKAVKIPVSVKTRLGWDRIDTLIPFCKRLIDAGAQALAIHGRRYHDKFTGKANWDPIYELKEAVSVPVIGNGDVMNAQDAVTKIKNLDGVMVGRGTFGNPWVMKEIVDALDGTNGKLKMDPSASSGGKSRPATFEEKIPWILEHCALAVRFKGERTGMLEMRRHLSSYVKGFDGAKEMREKLVRVEKALAADPDIFPDRVAYPKFNVEGLSRGDRFTV
jgi:tRNA-dihydrouridine synthase B